MLGLTIPDAIAFGSLCAAFLAALAGLLRGEGAGRRPATRGESADPRRDSLAALTAAIAELAAAIRAATSADLARDHYDAVIEAIVSGLDARDRGETP